MQNVLKRNFLLISIFVLLTHGSHCPCTLFPPGRQLALSTAPAHQACCQHTPHADPLFCSHVTLPDSFWVLFSVITTILLLGKLSSLSALEKNPNNIALNAPGCDFVLYFHLLGRFKCNIETCKVYTMPLVFQRQSSEK